MLSFHGLFVWYLLSASRLARVLSLPPSVSCQEAVITLSKSGRKCVMGALQLSYGTAFCCQSVVWHCASLYGCR